MDGECLQVKHMTTYTWSLKGIVYYKAKTRILHMCSTVLQYLRRVCC